MVATSTNAMVMLMSIAGLLCANGAAAHEVTRGAGAAAASGVSESPRELTRIDFEAWLDGFMPHALATGDIAGAVVALVQDGDVVLEKGYGFADMKTRRPIDPRGTLFRTGSISKAFTWTAVMQLVEAGKLDLDTDIDRYLDFSVRGLGDRPITLRHLMTHTPGFAETLKHVFMSPDHLIELGPLLKEWTPERIHPAGEVPAYSNYGAALAAYIVERVSGEPFNAYVARHIFEPLGMEHSSFAQPLPPALLAGMSSGYLRASDAQAQTYEFLGPAPAGSMATTADDMTRFMLAHLEDGQYRSVRILRAQTAQQMHAAQPQKSPPLNPMALGFYREDRNGHPIIGHAGDLEAFHSDMHLLLADHVGLFISMNSAGKEGAAHTVRTQLFVDFMDRYFPAPKTSPLATAATARAHGKLMRGTYWLSRRAATGFVRGLYLFGQTSVTTGPDDELVVSMVKDPSGVPFKWREVRPFRWTDASGSRTLVATVKDGKVVNFATDEFLPAVMIYQPVPLWQSKSWNVPLLAFTCVVLVGTLMLWPVADLVRKHFGVSRRLEGRSRWFYYGVRFTVVVDVLVIAGFLAIFSNMSGSHRDLLNDALDPWLRVLQLLCVLGWVGAALSVWNAVRVWANSRGAWTKVGETLIALACVFFAWFVVLLQLVTVSLHY